MSKLPEFVYLITVDGEWPVSAVPDDHPTNVPHQIERAVQYRLESMNVAAPSRVHVWKAKLTDVVEVRLTPAKTIPASIEEL